LIELITVTNEEEEEEEEEEEDGNLPNKMLPRKFITIY
jgi:hypothetical protein